MDSRALVESQEQENQCEPGPVAVLAVALLPAVSSVGGKQGSGDCKGDYRVQRGYVPLLSDVEVLDEGVEVTVVQEPENQTQGIQVGEHSDDQEEQSKH